MFSNGEKFNPVPMELVIGGNKILSGVLVIGQGRPHVGLLLEPKVGKLQDRATLIDELWPSVERANALAPAQGQIRRSQVHVVASGAFARAGKGTVIRKLSEKKLQKEVEELYLKGYSHFFLKSKSERPAVEAFVADVVADAFSTSLSLHDDLFAFGLDSLKASEIMHNLKAGIKPLLGNESLD